MLTHPFAPEAAWRFAISRSFHVPRVDQLYGEIVRPTLEGQGVILECSNASDDPESQAFWMNRMKVVLELADFHIFFQIGETPQVEFERTYSRTVTRVGKAPALAANFDLKRRQSRFFAPTLILIRGSWGLDRFSSWRNIAVVHCSASCALDDFGYRFTGLLDRCLRARSRRIEGFYRMEERTKGLADRIRPRFVDLLMKIEANRAQRDPKTLGGVGSVENARKMLEADLSNRAFHRPSLDVKRTLVQESELARIIARDPSTLNAYAQWKPREPQKVPAENEIEAYLHQIRRGEARFSQSFSETYQQELEKVHSGAEDNFNRLRDTPGRKMPISDEAREGWEEIKKLWAKMERPAAFWASLSFRRRVRQAKGKFHDSAPPE